MVVSLVNDKKDKISYIQLVVDVFCIFVLGIFLLIIFKTFNSKAIYFTITISVYLIVYSIYTLIYLNKVTNVDIIYGLHHRFLNFMNIYNIFLAIFLITIGLLYQI